MPPLQPKEKIRRIVESGNRAGAVFSRGKLHSLVEVWRHEGQIILTWEECLESEQYNEHLYTKDERHVFTTFGEALAFLDQQSVPLDRFAGIIKRSRENA